LLQALSLVFGSSFISSQDQLAISEQTATQSGQAAAGTTEIEKVAGIGGFFFRAHDPKALEQWYQQNLGISLTPSSSGGSVWQQEAGPTSFSPLPETTKYFGDPQKDWMLNFRVRDLDKMVAQLGAAGITVKVDPESYPYGRFARLHDPEGNPIELWQPKPKG